MKKEIIKPFDLAKAKAGAKLRTKGGYPVEIFKWHARGNYPIRGIIIEEKDDMSAYWKLDGSWVYDHTSNDLVIVEEVEEPKFKINDWITNGKCVYKIVRVTDIYYLENYREACVVGTIDVTDEYYHLWNFDDVKAGDVLVASDGSIFIFASVKGFACKHYVALTTDGAININEGLEHSWETSRAVHPADKEQRELLLSKLKEAGYEWDADALELKKIKPEFWSDDKSNAFVGFFIGTYGDIIEVSKLSNTVSNYNIFATKKQAKSALAMARISQIMANDIENFGGVVTDEEWENNEGKYIIYREENSVCKTTIGSDYYFLAFHTEKQRDLFLEKYPQLVRDFLMISDEETK